MDEQLRRFQRSSISVGQEEDMSARIEQYKRLCGLLWEALESYADPEFYHAVGFLADRPAGGFADDADAEHGHPNYKRPMPGKLARATLRVACAKHPDLVIADLSEFERDDE